MIMSARVLNPAAMLAAAEVAHQQLKLKAATGLATSTTTTTSNSNNNNSEMSNHNHNVITTTTTTSSSLIEPARPPGAPPRVCPSRAALAKVRRDLFGPVDHAAARALAERELRAQTALDSERWGFDFRLGVPLPGHPGPGSPRRYEWEIVGATEIVPEAYAFRGMPYLRKQAQGTSGSGTIGAPAANSSRKSLAIQSTPAKRRRLLGQRPPAALLQKSLSPVLMPRDEETTPPQERRRQEQQQPVTPEVTPGLAGLSVRSAEKRTATTPVSGKKQASITDFMKSRKRPLTCTGKSLTDPPEKIARSTGQIRS